MRPEFLVDAIVRSFVEKMKVLTCNQPYLTRRCYRRCHNVLQFSVPDDAKGGPSLQRQAEFSCEAAGSLVPGFCECSHRTSAVKAQPVILACCGKKFADRLSCGWRTLSQSAPFSIAC